MKMFFVFFLLLSLGFSQSKVSIQDKEIKINNIPKYMGFLEYLKTFEITSTDAFSG